MVDVPQFSAKDIQDIRDLARAELIGTGELAPLALSGTPPAPVIGQAYRWAPTRAGGAGKLLYRIVGLPAWARFEFETGAIYADKVASAAATASNFTIYAIDLTGVESSIASTIPAAS